MKRRNIALIPAAGVGARFGAGKPKQYVEIAGQTVLQHTLDIFLSCARIDKVAVVLSPEDVMFQAGICDKLVVLKKGGSLRAQSVRNGLSALLRSGQILESDNVLVHDAARCCLPEEALLRLLDEAGENEAGGILAVPLADTLKRVTAHTTVAETVPRDGLWLAQTPQLFRAGLLRRALEIQDLAEITDEASAVEKLGVRPLLVQGDGRNLKLTLPQDEALVRLLLQVKK